MTSALLLDDLRRDEALRTKSYPDPLSPLAVECRKPMNARIAGWAGMSGAPWTVGYGHTGSLAAVGIPGDVDAGTTITVSQAEILLGVDAQRAEQLCAQHLPWWPGLDSVRRDAVANMVFNMGWGDGRHGFSTFTNTADAMAKGDWDDAVRRLEASAWYRQVGTRAERICHMLQTGSRMLGARPVTMPPPPSAPNPAPAPVGWLGAVSTALGFLKRRFA